MDVPKYKVIGLSGMNGTSSDKHPQKG